jgi:hypothetical protein
MGGASNRHMTLKQFLSATSDVPEPVLREAITAALSVEPARTPDQYLRFYSRTLRELGLDNACLDCGEPKWNNEGGVCDENHRGYRGH